MSRNVGCVSQTMVALCIAFLVHHPLPALGSQAERPPLEILILEGDGVTNAVVRSRHEDPVVVVRSSGQPVKGAQVVFRLPDSGPGGSFGGNGTTWGGKTGNDGRCVGKGFVANKELGDYVIRVAASYRGETAEAKIGQTNAWLNSAYVSKNVKVRLRNRSTIKGQVAKVTKEGFTVVDKRSHQPVSVTNEEVAKLGIISLSSYQKAGLWIAVGALGAVVTVAALVGAGCCN